MGGYDLQDPSSADALLPQTHHDPISPSATSYPLPIPGTNKATAMLPITALPKYLLSESTHTNRDFWTLPPAPPEEPVVYRKKYPFNKNLDEESTSLYPANLIARQKRRESQGMYMCECCPKKPKKFDRQEDLEAHEKEKQYQCAYCNNRFKNQNEVERHQKSLHLRRHWSCAALSNYSAAFQSSEQNLESVTCGYCGELFPCSGSDNEIPFSTDSDWNMRISHLQENHKFGQCNHAKKFLRADYFRQHLKHSHSGTSGKWTNFLELACMKAEPRPDPIRGPERVSNMDSSAPRVLEKILEMDLESIAETCQKFDDTDTKTNFSKDSGYSSMVSKAQLQVPDDQEKPETSKWESESLASLQSFATIDTISSVNPAAAGGAAEELADMLVKDNLICDLIKKGYMTFGSDRFERNLRRILKTFAFGLRSEARNDLEKSAIRIVHNYRAYVIRIIRKRLELAEDKNASSMDNLHTQKRSQIALRRFLEHHTATEETSAGDPVRENELGSDIDSDLSNDEQPYISTLENVKLYLLSSTAYTELKQQLTDFVTQSKVPKPLGRRKSPVFELKFEQDDMTNGEETNFVAEGVVDSKVGLSYPQFGSPSLGATKFTYNATLDTLPPYEELRCLQAYDSSFLGDPCLKEIADHKTSEKSSEIDYQPNFVEDKKETLKPPGEDSQLDISEPKFGPLEEYLLSMEPWVLENPRFLSRWSLKFSNWWSKTRRKSVAKNHYRFEWTCACGHSLFADFGPKSQTSLARFTAAINTTPSSSPQIPTSQPLTATLALPPSAYLQSPVPANATSQIPYTHKKRKLTRNTASHKASPAFSQQINISFLELCVNTGAHLKSLAEIDVANISTDGALFQSLRKQYLRLRGFRSRFWLLKPSSVSFVRASEEPIERRPIHLHNHSQHSHISKFSLENRHRVGILQKPLSLPPKSLVDAKQWVYDPCPLEGDPPIAEDLFLHYLQCSEGSPSLFWLLRFPRKLETSLLNSACETSASFGWGIHIDEGPDFAALFRANFLVLVMSGVAAGLWKLFERDFQGAFGFACWILAVLNSLLVAYMFKWRQE